MESRVQEIINFFDKYHDIDTNPATLSKFDANANVTSRNIATMQAESIKKLGIDVQRKLAYSYIERDFGRELADKYFEDLSKHIIYTNDESTLGGYPYCCSISLYPFLLNGLKDLGGSSGAPKHANSFIGGLVNLIFLVAGQFAGAVAIVEFLPYLDHFLRLDYGQDYIEHLDDVVERVNNHEFTLRHKVNDLFQEFVFAVNQPAGSRNYQSPFTNIAYYDEFYFKSLFQDFFFPDGDVPCWETTKELQKMFMNWFIDERNKEVLTFPVETVNMLHDGKEFKDREMADFVADAWARGGSFFLYNSDSVDALSSCCRLKNSIEENTFSYTLGAGSIQTGSKRVITLNINRIVQDWYKVKDTCTLKEYITPIVCRVHKYLEAWNNKLWDDYNSGLLTIYSAGFIDLDKQYLTVGFNGFLESAEFLRLKNDTVYNGIDTKKDNAQYKQLAKDILETIKDLNKQHRTIHCKFNTEMIPGESVGPKHYKWDKEDGYWVPECRNSYNSYFYPVEDETCDIISKIYLQGTDFIGCLDGGSACHLNLETLLSKEQYKFLMKVFIKAGCSYVTFNTVGFQCEDCGYISKTYGTECSYCHSNNITYYTRIIGYLKKVKYWADARKKEFKKRYLSTDKDIK